jgi:prolyl-tRNA synthetase
MDETAPDRRFAAIPGVIDVLNGASGSAKQARRRQSWANARWRLPMVTLDDAKRVIGAAEKKAVAIGQPMNVAVADAGGNLIAHVRMDGAWMGSIDISIKKAFTA